MIIDPCSCLGRLDLSNERDLELILKRDKHGRLEGLCAEALFLEQLVLPSFPEVSLGWWVSRTNGIYRVARFITQSAAESGLDRKIYRHLLRNNVSVVRISFDESTLICSRENAALTPSGDILFQNRKPQSPTKTPPSISGERDATRIEKAINFLRGRKLLRAAAIQRLLANCFIHAASAWDIDAIVESQGALIALESKQKYPTAAGTFGMNDGLARMFRFLQSTGIRVVHVVLTKPVWNTKISAIDLLQDTKYAGKSIWIACDGSSISKEASGKWAPARTSIGGSYPLAYSEITLRDFVVLGACGVKLQTPLCAFLLGKGQTLAGLSDIPKVQ